MNRRDILKFSATSLSLLSFPGIASTKNTNIIGKNNKKLVWVLLRGGMDGLHATPPLFDKNLMTLRKDLVAPIRNNALPISRGFALHPELSFFHALYNKKQLNTVVATATPVRNRSHFIAQDFIESGLTETDVDDGWLARTIKVIDQKQRIPSPEGLAVARSLPIAMRGTNKAMTWYPSSLPPSSDDLHQRLQQLYKNNELLTKRLQQALATQQLVDSMAEKKQRGKLPDLAKSCAQLIKSQNGPDVAMLEMGGWDTHNNQVNILNRRFKELNSGIKSLHDELEDQWQDTLVIITSEFGRTVEINGTGGTDHGTATTMFLTGGAISKTKKGGGKVLGRWPSLVENKLYEKRDLRPTSNTFEIIAYALKEHWQLSKSQINEIFPKV